MDKSVKKLSKEFASDWVPDVCNKTAFSKHVKPLDGMALVVGSKVYNGKNDRRGLYSEALGVDMLAGEGVDIVHDMTEPLKILVQHIDCVSMLEHCDKPWLAAQNMTDALQPGGTILLSAPFMWRIHGYPDDYFRYTPNGIRSLFPGIEWKKLSLMCCGVEVKRNPAIGTKYNDAYLKSEVWGFGFKRE